MNYLEELRGKTQPTSTARLGVKDGNASNSGTKPGSFGSTISSMNGILYGGLEREQERTREMGKRYKGEERAG